MARVLTHRDTKVAVSLGSGGIRMFAHISVLRFLEKLGAYKHIDELWGASGGAVVSLLYSMGLDSAALQEVTDHYFGNGKSTIRLAPTGVNIAMQMIREAVFPKGNGKPFSGFHSIHRELHSLIEEASRLQKGKMPCYMLAYNLETNQTDVLTPHEVPEGLYSDFIYRTDPLEAMIASSSVPVLFVPKTIEDANGRRVYSDGGIGEEVPTLSIYKKWVIDREAGLEKRKRLLVIAVDLGSELSAMGIFENWLLKRVPTLRMTARLTDLVRKARIAEQKRVLLQDPNVELWEINFNLPQVGLLDTHDIPKVMEIAETLLPEQMTRINDSLLG
ncbi:MAG TPA: patatin-like phospholipase family protein [bacterium]|nr:patatin-like phospholipase family protein [bacterium]